MKKVVLFELLSAIDLDILVAEEKEAKKCRKQRIRHNIVLLLPIILLLLVALFFLLIRFFPQIFMLFGASAPAQDSKIPAVSDELLLPAESSTAWESEETLTPPGYIASKGLSFRLDHTQKTASVTGIGICTDTKVYIPYETEGYTVTEVDAHAFEACLQMTHVTVPHSVRSIGESAFFGCTELETVEISSSIETIGKNAFRGCTRLVWFTYDNALYLGNSEIPCLALIQPIHSEIEVCTLYPATRLIAADAFDDCSALQSVVINDSLLFINDNAFQDCDALTTLTLPRTLKRIGEAAFFQYGKLALTYKGHYSEWEAITLHPRWLIGDEIVLYCTDGIYRPIGQPSDTESH